MIRPSLLLLALLASACSTGPSPEQQRIAALEQENAQLRDDLKRAKGDVTKLHSILARGDAGDDGGADAPVGPVVPEGIMPQPQNNANSSAADPA
jgi:hypothetical protein